MISRVGAAALLALLPQVAHAQADSDWSLHGQVTVVEQYHPAFRAPYSGTNSMDPGSRGDETVTATLYAGARPWDGAEVWANGEIDQGFGLSDTLGAAAFTNGEGSKVGKAEPYFRLQRLFLRQTFDLGGDAQTVEDDANQFAGTRTADNLIVTIGKFSTVDIFDNNAYAHDASESFLNWAIIDAGAFDYAADAWGYSYGGAAEWNVDAWSLRAGLFDLSRVPNGPELVRGLGQYQVDGEIERCYSLFGEDGKVRLLGFVSRGRLGSYRDAIMSAPAGGVPDTGLVRTPVFRGGGAINVEQELTKDLGIFFRASLTDGSHEADEFTDMDNSVAAGLSLKGTSWDRADDVVGLALESGGISRAARAYFAAGGLGILIGDGRLAHYDRENVLEGFYDAAVWKSFRLAADYQLIDHPAYNSERGPISVLGGRLHAAF